MKKIKTIPKAEQAHFRVKLEISARHIHLSQKDLEKLFGKNYQLKKKRQLSQPEEFAAEEIVTLVKNKNIKLRIVGPVRKISQIELARTDAVQLNINAPLKLSGDLKNVKTTLEVIGPKGKTKVKTIVARRHLHISTLQAKKFVLKKNQKVKVAVMGERGLVFENIIVRPSKDYELSCHIDTDEANACGLDKVCGLGQLII